MYKKKGLAYMFVAPMLLFLIIFLIYPFIINIYNSFFKYSSALDQNPTFVTFGNYVLLFKDKYFSNAVKNTGILIVFVIIFQVGIALILALLVDKISRLKTFYRVTFFIPIIISATALGLMFSMFLKYEGGLINQILGVFSIKPVKWLDIENGKITFFSMMTPVIWQYIGFYFVIFITGLATIPKDLLEAADIDGANEVQRIFKIKLPLLQNVTRTVIVLAITGTLKVFDLPFILNKTAYPNGETFILGTYMYQLSFFANQNLGLSAAFAVVLAALGVLLSGIVNTVFKQNTDIMG